MENEDASHEYAPLFDVYHLLLIVSRIFDCFNQRFLRNLHLESFRRILLAAHRIPSCSRISLERFHSVGTLAPRGGLGGTSPREYAFRWRVFNCRGAIQEIGFISMCSILYPVLPA
nr:hypothetical protein [uncultured Oscillibacter sp.]